MANKKFMVGMLAGLLTFGLAVTGCDDSGSYDETSSQTNLPASSGANDLSGKTYFRGMEKTVFSTTAAGASNGTYSVFEAKYSKTGIVLDNGKYTYVETKAGSYSWNESKKTVTFSLKKAAMYNEDTYGYGALLTKVEYRAARQTEMDKYIAREGEAAVTAEFKREGFSSISEYLDYMVNEEFANKTNDYSFNTGNTALFLAETLPANKGANELNGKEFTMQGNRKVKFTSESEYSIKNDGGTTIETGEYRYDTSDVNESGGKRVYQKPLTKNGMSVVQYYDSLGESNAGYFESADAKKASDVNISFYSITQFRYYLSGNTIN